MEVRFDLNEEDIRNSLKSGISPILNYVRCVILYGSFSDNSSLTPQNSSDIDLFVVFKPDVNPYLIINDLENTFSKNNVNIDLCWYTENHFLSLLNQKIDIYLWKSIFLNGEELHSENNFIKKIQKIILETNITSSFNHTIRYRQIIVNCQLKQKARNLSRLLTEKILRVYCNINGINKIKDIPELKILLRKVGIEKIVPDSILETQYRLIELSGLPMDYYNLNRIAIVDELVLIEKAIEKYE